jgi:hypothetical protein
MINNHVYTIRPDGTPAPATVAAAAPAPKVTIGSVRVSSKTPNASAASGPSQ